MKGNRCIRRCGTGSSRIWRRVSRAARLGQIAKVDCMLTYINLHLLVETIVHDQAMGHPNPMGLHRMT